MRKSIEIKCIYGAEKDNYPGLPKELEEFNYFINDGETGHIIMAIPETELSQNGNPYWLDKLDNFEQPFPVKYIIEKGYRMYRGHVVCDGKYDSHKGLVIDKKYYEPNRELGVACKKNVARFSAGQILPEFKGKPVSTTFDMDDDGAIIKVILNSPTEMDVKQFDPAAYFYISYTKLMPVHNVIMFTVKFGDLDWITIPYVVHFSKNLHHMPMIHNVNGMALEIVLIDSETGKVCSEKMLHLDRMFSIYLCEEIDEQRAIPFDQKKYDESLKEIYKTYSVKAMMLFSSGRCIING